MNSQQSSPLWPVIYLPHGGGPMPLLGEPTHEPLVRFLENLGEQIGQPSAVVVISAHWEEAVATCTSGAHPEILYDYHGFPAEAYQIDYPVPGSPQLANELVRRLNATNCPSKSDDWRGFDHGLYIPLKLIYPDARIPCIQLSLLHHLDARKHIEMGRAIQWLREKKVLILGSGMSYHNMRAFFSKDAWNQTQCEAFDRWLIETCTDSSLTLKERDKRLIAWDNAPYARDCHPREEHLLPLHVCYGAASPESPEAEVVFNDLIMGKTVTGFMWR